MGKKVVTEDTIIQNFKATQGNYDYVAFFKQATGKNISDFATWLNTQVGKTAKEALVSYCDAAQQKNMEQRLSEERYSFISEQDKAFIVAFDKQFEELGYDHGGGIGGDGSSEAFTIKYGKTSVKSRPCPARIHIKASGEVVLRLYFKNIDKHSQYIENAPLHVKEAFVIEWGDCKSCMPHCKSMKIYIIDGQLYNKCCHSTAFFKIHRWQSCPITWHCIRSFIRPKNRSL